MEIHVNGERHEVPPALSVTALLLHLSIRRDRVAIERNLEVLPRHLWDSTQISDGDRFEIVQLVGGGD